MERDYASIINSLRSLENSSGCHIVGDLMKGERISTAPAVDRNSRNSKNNNNNNNCLHQQQQQQQRKGSFSGTDFTSGLRPFVSNNENSELSAAASEIIKKLEAVKVNKENIDNAGNRLLQSRDQSRSQIMTSQSQLPLHQQEELAAELVKDISKFNKSKIHNAEQLPPHLADFAAIYESMKEKNEKQKSGEALQLPIIKILKPEEQKRAALLPPPSEGEKKSLKRIDAKLNKIQSTEIYDYINEKSTLDSNLARKNHTDDPIVQVIESSNKSNAVMLSNSSSSKSASKSASVLVPASKSDTLFDMSDKYKQRVQRRSDSIQSIFGGESESGCKIGEESVKTDASVIGSIMTRSTLTSAPIGPKNNPSPGDYPFDTELKHYLSNLSKKYQHNESNYENLENCDVIVNGSTARIGKNIIITPNPNSIVAAAPDPYSQIIKGLPNRSSTASATTTGSKSKIDRARGFEHIRRRSIDSDSSISPKNQNYYLGLFTPVLLQEYNAIMAGSSSSHGSQTSSQKTTVVMVASSSSSSSEFKEEFSNLEESIKESKNSPKKEDLFKTSTKTANSPELAVKSISQQDNILSIAPKKPSPSKHMDDIDVKVNPIVEAYAPVIEETIVTANEIVNSHKSVHMEYRRATNDFRKLGHEQFMDNVKTSLYDEMGINVDPLYTKGRLYGKAVKFLLFYVYSLKIKSTLQHWRHQVAKINQVRMRSASAMLNRIARGMLARKLLRDRMANIRKQREGENERKKKEAAKLRWAKFIVANKLNVWCRRKVKVIRRKKLEAAINIAKVIRGYLGRKKAARTRKIRSYFSSFAIKIQMAYRMRLANRRALLYRKLKYVREVLSAMANRHKAIELYNRQTGAAWKIIKCYRINWLCKKKIKRVMYWKKIRQITHIQATMRRFVARRKVGRLLAIQRKIDAKRRDAAIVIQCMARCKIAMNRSNEKKYKNYLKFKERIKSKQEITTKRFFAQRVWARRVRYYFRWKFMPCVSDIELHEKAIIIQKTFRRLRGKNNYIKKRIQVNFRKAREKKALQLKCSIIIQKIFRGYMCRVQAFKKRQVKMALMMQCAYRQKLARKKVDYIRKVKLATFRVNKMLLRYIAVRKRWKKRLYIKKYGKYVLILQRFARRCMGKKFFDQLKSSRRCKKEISDVSIMRINKMIVGMQLKIIHECINRPINVQAHLFSNKTCICNGPLQALFVNEVVKNGIKDEDALSTNRADALCLQNFAKRVEGMVLDGKPDGEITFNYFKPKRAKGSKDPYDISSNRPGTSGKDQIGKPASGGSSKEKEDKDDKKKKKKGKGSIVKQSDAKTRRSLPYSILFDYLKNGSILLFIFPKKLEPVEIDIAFNNVKEYDETSVNYSGFAAIMAQCANMVSGQAVEKEKKKNPSGVARREQKPKIDGQPDEPEGQDWEEESKDMEESKDVEENESDCNRRSRTISFENQALVGEIVRRQSSIKKNNLKFDGKYQKLMNSMIYKPSAVQADITMSYILKALMSFLKEDWIIDIINYLEGESRNKLGSFVTRIQCLCRKKKAFKVYAVKVIEKKKRDDAALVAHKIIKLQALIRRVIGLKKAAKQAQSFLIHYIPFEGAGYWYNERTKISQYNKPKILGKFDCLTVPLPPTGLEYVVKCNICPLQAKFNCLQCEDSFCKQCFQNFHSKGSRINHKTVNIAMCPYCRIQMTTKFCESCMTRRPKVGSIQELLFGTQRGMYCDSCFTHAHDGCEKRLEKNEEIKKADRHLLYKTRDAYLVSHQMHAKLITDHKYEDVVQPCEECKWRAAAWRCNDCVQIYCNHCLIGLHSNGGPFSKHDAERLPYFTCEMSKNYDRDYFKQIISNKMQLLAKREAKKKEEIFWKSLIKVQTWWRQIYWGKIGRAMIKSNRKKQRKMALKYKLDTETVRNTADFKLDALMGSAPCLSSDNIRDLVLRTISSVNHKFADHFILQNKSDMRSKKGWGKTGYAVGTIAELKEQATYGGFRLHGLHNVHQGRSTVHITCPLEEFLNPGEMVRIKTQLFRVIKCDDKKSRLVLSRKWRGKDEMNLVIYKMPSYGNEEYNRLFSFKYWLYDAVIVKNPFVTKALGLHGKACTRMYNIAGSMMRKDAEAGDLVGALKWRKKSLMWFKKSMWSSNFVGGDELDDVDLSKMINPEDLKRQNEAESRDKMEQEKKARNMKAAKKIAKKVETDLFAGVEDGTNFFPETLISSSVEEDSTIIFATKGESDLLPDDISVLTTDTNQFEKERIAAAASSSSPANRMNPITETGSVGSPTSKDSKFSKLPPKPKPAVQRPPGVDWYATREEIEWRKSREFLMTREELAAEAHEWEECVDPLTEVIFYRHIATCEITASIPKSLQHFRDMQEEKERNIKNYQDANRRIKLMSQTMDNRRLLNGQRNRIGYGK